ARQGTNYLRDAAKVVIDDRMVPHIFAENEIDIYYLQGYLHAQNRLFQMDLSTRAAAGTLSEILGNRTLAYDQYQRSRGMAWSAEQWYSAMKNSTEEMKVLEVYTKGVNDYIDQLSPEDYPIEYKLLGAAPSKWNPLRSINMLINLCSTLNFGNNDLRLTNTRAYLGDSLFQDLYPEYNEKQSPIIPIGTDFDFVNALQEAEDVIGMNVIKQWVYPDIPQPSEYFGSNNWSVSGTKTASKVPILSSDPHLNLSMPSLWYENHLKTPDFNAHGVVTPGIPGCIIGFNDHIAWGETNSGWDVTDWYTIKWMNDNRTKYELDGKSKDVDLKVEVYKVKGQTDVLDTVKYTIWGPVVYEDETNEYDGMALHWLTHDVPAARNHFAIGTLTRMLKAKNYEEFSAALTGFHAPAQNFVFASTNGDIGIHIAGDMPIKRNQQGRFFQDGSNSSNQWAGIIPFDQLPNIKNPERGYASSANQHPTDTTYPYYYSHSSTFEDYRGRMVNILLDSMENINVNDMKEMQNNSYSLRAADGVHAFMANLEGVSLSDTATTCLDMIKNWDFYYTAESKAATFFNYWLSECRSVAFDEFNAIQDSIAITRPENFRLFELLENEPDHIIFDQVETEEREMAKDVVRLSLENASRKFSKLSDEQQLLYNHKNITLDHIASIPGLGTKQLKTGGTNKAINAINNGGGGPSWRMIVEMEQMPKGYAVYPGGQSGNPGSSFYDTFVDTWASGKYYNIELYEKPDLVKNPIKTIDLK
ncbi:MAG: penicillin acylase family protein, partial [Bacteroidota bacterium]